MISNDIFIALYFLKKVIHGYNLDSNTLDNILNVSKYTKNEILNSVKNQSYLGFQIFKKADEARTLLHEALNDNLILKYFSHVDSTSILRIANNLAKIESILKNENNFDQCAESGIEFTIVNGKDINPENEDKYLLLKKTAIPDRFIVYDSGIFDPDILDMILNRYILKSNSSSTLAELIYETIKLMRPWTPDVTQLSKNESRFRIIKEFFSPSTYSKTKTHDIYIADIVQAKGLHDNERKPMSTDQREEEATQFALAITEALKQVGIEDFHLTREGRFARLVPPKKLDDDLGRTLIRIANKYNFDLHILTKHT